MSDGTVAIFMSMLFFVIPSQLPRFRGYGYNEEGEMLTFNPTTERKYPLTDMTQVSEDHPSDMMQLFYNN